MSELQNIVGEALKFWFPDTNILTNYRPPWLFGMELDFFLPELNFAVEVQGRQHKLWCPEMQPNVQDFKDQRKRDNRKRAILNKRGVRCIYPRSMTGIYSVLRNAFPDRKFPILPKPLRDRWKAYRKITHNLRNEKWVAVKVKSNGELIGVNRTASNYLKTNPPT